MITIKPKTRAKIELSTVEELVPYLQKVSKNWRGLTPIVQERLQTLLSSSPFFTGLSHLSLVLRKDILQMRSGTFSRDEYRDIFGWSELEIGALMNSKGQIFKKHCAFTPGQKEFWMQHHDMTEADAIIEVSKVQSKLSKRPKKTKINQPTSIDYYIHRGYSAEDATKAQSKVQKKRRNNCIEYWLHKGYSEEEAKKRISELQKKRSKLSIDYWLHRGYSLEEAQENSEIAIKNQCTGRISKVSQKFFNEVVGRLLEYGFTEQDFLYGENEHRVFITPKRRLYLDFLHVPSNKVIEFDGRYWHDLKEQQDSERDCMLTELGYKILRIPETYNKSEWNKYIITAITFLKE